MRHFFSLLYLLPDLATDAIINLAKVLRVGCDFSGQWLHCATTTASITLNRLAP